MSTKHGGNFTGFQNIGLRGTGGKSAMLEMAQGATNAASTLSVSMISGSTVGSENGSVEAPYFHISGGGLSLGTGYLRFTKAGSAPYATLSIGSRHDSDSAWTLPAKTGGIIPLFGTLSVGLETIAAAATYSTNIVVAGNRAEDRYIFQFTQLNGTATTRGIPVVIGSHPTNTGVELLIMNYGSTGTVAGTWEMGYVRVR